jgi:hypothetical protein
VAQPVTDHAQPAAFGAIAEQDVGDGQAEEFAVGQLGWVTRAPAGLQQFVDGDLQCDDEVVETGVHEASWRSTLRSQRQLSAASSRLSPLVRIRHQ